MWLSERISPKATFLLSTDVRAYGRTNVVGRNPKHGNGHVTAGVLAGGRECGLAGVHRYSQLDRRAYREKGTYGNNFL